MKNWNTSFTDSSIKSVVFKVEKSIMNENLNALSDKLNNRKALNLDDTVTTGFDNSIEDHSIAKALKLISELDSVLSDIKLN